FGKGELLAKVGDNTLYLSDIKGVFYAGISQKDSVDLLHNYIENWAQTMIKIEKAKELFADEDKDIESLINAYRNSLLINKYDNFHLTDIDTTVTHKQLTDYYTFNKELFRLPNPIVTCRILIFPRDYKQEKELKKLLSSKKENDKTDFLEIVEKNRFTYIEYLDWSYFTEVISNIPFKEKQFDDFLKENKDYEVIDQQNKYILIIDSYLNSNETAPLEMVSTAIKRMIVNSRKTEKLKYLEDSIYNDALLNNNIIFTKNL
ncbi:MAG: hypothetical protein R3Y04_08500, partial [Rikenellaceae bacterium]